MMKRKHSVLNICITVIAIALLSYLIGYFGSINSDAFTKASSFISQSNVVKRELGDKLDIKLSPFGYNVEFAGDSGTAQFDCKIIGSKSVGKIFINLIKSGGVWQVTEAQLRIDEQYINLM